MGAPSNYRPSQLPRRFPVGATMWSKELAARKGICALSPATWFCLADGGSTFPLCGSSAPFLLVIDLRQIS
jgi:hypothetical protein